MLGMHLTLYGKVQGVGLRRSAQIEAARLHIVGYARNLPGGSVEIYASGAKQDLEKFVDFLQRNFEIGECKIKWEEAEKDFSSFSIN